MDTIVMPHDAAGSTTGAHRPIDLHDHGFPAMDQTISDTSHETSHETGVIDDVGVLNEAGDVPPYGPTAEYTEAMNRKRRRQSVLFGASALVIALAAIGFIEHKPFEAALSRLRDHTLQTAATKPVTLPHPMTSGAALGAGSGAHTVAHPLNNGIPGISVTPAGDHSPPTDSSKSKSMLPGPPGTPDVAPGASPSKGTQPVPVFPANDVPRATTTQIPSIATASASPPASTGNTPHLSAATMVPLHETLPPRLSTSAHPVAPLLPTTAGATVPGAGTAGAPAYTASPLVGPLPKPETLQSIPHPVAVAAKLVAAPASTSDEVKTDALVSALGKLVGELRSENIALLTKMDAMQNFVDHQLTSFNARLTFDQAHDTLALAGAAHPPFAHPASPQDVTSSQIFPARAKHVAPVNPASYHIHAASQGLADIYRNGVPYEVSVGSVVPGVGRVISIDQYGSSWIVRTDHGVIH